MKTFRVVLSFLVLCLAHPALAKPAGPPPPLLRIVEVNAVSITVTVGKSGNEHFTYKITDHTKVTLNGAPVDARDLRAGMVARTTLGPDHTTALSVAARDPRR